MIKRYVKGNNICRAIQFKSGMDKDKLYELIPIRSFISEGNLYIPDRMGNIFVSDGQWIVEDDRGFFIVSEHNFRVGFEKISGI